MRQLAHHPWCNFWSQPADECRMCARLFAEYPIDEGERPSDLMARHFPQNMLREGTGDDSPWEVTYPVVSE